MAQEPVTFSWGAGYVVTEFDVSQSEGEAAILETSVGNPGIGPVLTGVNQRGTLTVPGHGAIFSGVVNSVPSNLARSTVKVEFLAQPDDFPAKLAEFADGLRERPYFDVLFFPRSEDGVPRDPAEVLETRAAHFHVHPVTHEITLSDVLVGDRVIDLGGHYDVSSIAVNSKGHPLKKATATLVAEFEQTSTGRVEISQRITPHEIKTLTPDVTSLGDHGGFGSNSGWTVDDASFTPGTPYATREHFYDGESQYVWLVKYGNPPQTQTKLMHRQRSLLYWKLKAERMFASWDYVQPRRETMALTMEAGVQAVIGTADREEHIGEFSVSPVHDDPLASIPEWEADKDYEWGDLVRYKGQVWQCRLDHCSTGTFTVVPTDRKAIFISRSSASQGSVSVLVQWVAVPHLGGGALKSREAYSFLDTGRGNEAAEHMALRLNAFLRRRMRCVEVKFRGVWEDLGDVTLKDSVRIEHPSFPGGECTGKVIAYRKHWTGEKQMRFVEVTLGVSLATGDAAPALPGNTSYSEAFADGYAYVPSEDGYTHEGTGVAMLIQADAIRKPVLVERLHVPSYAVTRVVWKNLLQQQLAYARERSRQTLDLRDGVPKTSYEVALRSLASHDMLERKLSAACAVATGPRGIDLGA